MKNKLLLLLFLAIVGELSAQSLDGDDLPKHSEYWYASFKISILNNVSVPLSTNPVIFMNTIYGDMEVSQAPFTYSPGFSGGFFYNFDFKNNRMGIVLGIESQNYGFIKTYKNSDNDFRVNSIFRTTSLNLPVYFKIWSSDIYKTQTYASIGFGYTKYLNGFNYQTSNWDSFKYIRKLTPRELHSSSLFGQLGFNTDIYYFNIKYTLNNFLNEDYIYLTDEGSLKPYNAVDYTNNIYLEVGINLPITRWLTTNYWGIEKIRRAFKRKR